MPTIRSYNKRLEALKSERSSFMPLWRELSDYHLSHRGRFLTSDRNKGKRRDTNQINNTSRLAVRTIASGMMAGITSPARPWFRLGSGNLEFRENVAVREWLSQVEMILYRVFSASNLYNSLHAVYGELSVFGTAPLGVFQDFGNVIWCKPYTVGSYMVGMNGQNVIDTFYREYEITVAQCVKTYGLENCSSDIQNRWKTGNTESWVSIVYLTEPNDDRDNNSPLAKDKVFRSVHYEKSQSNGLSINEFLKQSGFDEFPILCPRWDVTGEDIYAIDCPGMTTLGDTKALQLGERRMYQALDKIVDPPLQGPSTIRDSISGDKLVNGKIYWYAGENGQGLKTVYDFRPDIEKMQDINVRTENRIQRGFYEDLFLALTNTDRRQITAREVAEKHEEKLLMLGPVLERLHNELLDPLIDRTFNILQNSGALPPPPPELEDRDIGVEYVSVLAQAQRLVATGALERFGGYVGNLAQIWPNARHKFNAEQSADEYADALGLTPGVVRSDDEVAEIVAAEQLAAQQQQAAEQAANMADVAKTASEADLSSDNVLGATAENIGLV